MLNDYIIEIVLFVAFTIILACIFRKSLLDFKSYGFPRFFAFEIIFALLLLNARVWFVHVFSTLQILSWIFLINSLVFVISGFSVLRRYGESQKHIENTTVLVKKGIFRFIRHPLYASLFLFGWGVFFKNPSYVGAILGVGLSVCLHLTAKREERENLVKFGEEYRMYMQNTRMFIPYIY